MDTTSGFEGSHSDSLLRRTPCTTLIVWQPKLIFFPPVQERPPPKRIFKHIDLEVGEARGDLIKLGVGDHLIVSLTCGADLWTSCCMVQCEDLPDHQARCPSLFLNDTFVRFLFNPPRNLPFYPYPCERDHDQDQEHEEEHVTDKDQDQDQEESSLESIDETVTVIITDTQIEDCSYSQTEPQAEQQKSDHQTTDFTPYSHPIDEDLSEQDLTLNADHSQIWNQSESHEIKVVLKRKSPELDLYLSNGTTDARTPDVPSKRSRTHDGSDEEDNASIEQWRVGKRPGHQGSYFHSPANKLGEDRIAQAGNSDSVRLGKRKPSHSIINSAERVLKKPFRPPTRIHAAEDSKSWPRRVPATTSASPRSPPSSVTQRDDAKHGERHSAPAAVRSTVQRAASSKIKASKPFQTPAPSASGAKDTCSKSTMFHSPAPGQVSSSAQIHGDSDQRANHQSLITMLEKEIMTHKQAIKYVAEGDEERLEALIEQWRTAGRAVVERIFEIVPRPTQEDEQRQSQYNASTQGGMYGFDTPHRMTRNHWDNEPPWSAPKLTEEQEEYLRNAPTNRDGDPVDEDGNLLIPDGGTEEDMRILMESAGTVERFGTRWNSAWHGDDRHGPAIPTHDAYNSIPDFHMDDSADCAGPQPTSQLDWTYGTLMSALGVDPAVLGWDAKADDWLDYSANLASLD